MNNMADLFLTEKYPKGIKEFLLQKEMPITNKEIFDFFKSIEWKIFEINDFINHVESNYPTIIKNLEKYLEDDLFKATVVPMNLQEITNFKKIITDLGRVIQSKEIEEFILDILDKNDKIEELSNYVKMVEKYEQCSLNIFLVLNNEKMQRKKEKLKLT
jgi:hypothetical protein